MTKTEWLDYFEAINGRVPSEAEVAQAFANGEFTEDESAAAASYQTSQVQTIQTVPLTDAAAQQIQPTEMSQPFSSQPNQFQQGSSVQPFVQNQGDVYSKPKRRNPFKVLLAKGKWGIAAVVIVSLLIIAFAAVGIRYATGGADGYWEMTDVREYNYKTGKWDTKSDLEDEGYSYNERLMQIKSDSVSFYFHEKVDSDSDDYEYYSYDITNDLGATYKVNRLSRSLTPSLTGKQYADKLSDIMDNYKDDLYYEDDELERSVNLSTSNYVAGYSKAPTYQVKGNQLIVSSYDYAGNINTQTIYKRLSDSKAQDWLDILDDIKKDGEPTAY